MNKLTELAPAMDSCKVVFDLYYNNFKLLNQRDISNRGGIWNFRLLVVQPLYTMTRSEILPGGIIIRRSVLKVIV